MIERGAARPDGLYPSVPVPPQAPGGAPERAAAALALLASREAALRRTARRFSLCRDDADDAYQRAVEILLTRSPPRPPHGLAAWMHVVVRREALAVRRSRERLLGTLGADEATFLAWVASERPGPHERAERRERVRAAAGVLAGLKPHERLAVVLQAEGYSYAEICRLCGWSYTKVNRLLAEGRARLRSIQDRPGESATA